MYSCLRISFIRAYDRTAMYILCMWSSNIYPTIHASNTVSYKLSTRTHVPLTCPPTHVRTHRSTDIHAHTEMHLASHPASTPRHPMTRSRRDSGIKLPVASQSSGGFFSLRNSLLRAHFTGGGISSAHAPVLGVGSCGKG